MKKIYGMIIAVGCVMALSAAAETLVVTTTADTFPVAAAGSLREAIANANDGDTITFDSTIAGQTITIYGTMTAKDDTSLVINGKALTIVGPNGGIAIDGGLRVFSGSTDMGSRIFFVTNAPAVTTFRNLTLKCGHGRGWNAAGSRYFQGGAIGTYSPVRVENCKFIQNGVADQTAYAPNLRGGGAIYAEADLALYGCSFISNSVMSGTMSHGGAILLNGGTLTAENCLFDSNQSSSFCGGVYLSPNVTGAVFRSCMALNNVNGGGNSVNAGFLWSEMAAGRRLDITRCVFRRNQTGSGGMGGAAYIGGGQKVCIIDCEFTDNTASCGGAVRSHGNPTTYISCSFSGNTCNQWGPAIDIRNTTYVVNCTFAGNMHRTAQGTQCGGALTLGSATKFLNCAFAYNYLNASTEPSFATDIAKFGGNYSCINTIYNGKDNSEDALTLATTLETVPSATRLFENYGVVTNMVFAKSTVALGAAVVVPSLTEDPKGKYFSKVLGIDRAGILASSGYPVRANADYSFIEYTTDKGESWTSLFGTDDGKAVLIKTDQRGIEYQRGRTPIGAATGNPITGSVIIVL